MSEELNPITGLENDKPKKSKIEVLTSSGGPSTKTSAMRDLTEEVDVSETLQQSAPTKKVRLLDGSDFKTGVDESQLLDKYAKNLEQQKLNYLKELDAEQNVLESTLTGVGKLLGKTASSIGLGLMGTGWAVAKSIYTQDASNLVKDNVFTEAEEKVSSYFDENWTVYSDNPNYYNMEVWEKMIYEPGKFLGDDVVDMASFMAGAIGQEMVLSAITAGSFGSATPLQASQTARMFNRMSRLGKAKKYAKAGSMADDVARTTNNLKSAGQAAKLSNFMKESGARSVGLFGAVHYEAGIEARQAREDIINMFKQEYAAANDGKQPSAEDLKRVEESADKAMWTTYGMNAAILVPSHLIQFGSIFKKNFKGMSAISDMNKRLAREGSEYVTKASQKGKLNKFLTYSYLTAKNPVTEAWEEFAQGASHEGALEYFSRDFSPEHNKNSRDFFSTYGHAAKNYFMSKEGRDSMSMGMLMGILGMPLPRKMGGYSGGIIGEIKDYNSLTREAQEVVNRLNASNLQTSLKNNFKNMVKFSSIQEDMLSATEKEDIFSFKNLEHDNTFSYMHERIKLGLKEDIIDDINKLKDLSVEEFNQEFGDEFSEYTEEEQAGVIKKALEFVDNIEKFDKAAQAIVNNNIRNAKPEDKELIQRAAPKMQEYLTHAASTLQNLDIREEQLINRLSEISNFTQEDITEFARKSNHYKNLSKLSQLAKKEKKGDKLTAEESKAKQQALKEVGITAKQMRELAEEVDAIKVDDLFDLIGEFDYSQGVDQEEFIKAASEKIEEFAKQNPTKGIVHKQEIIKTVSDIAQLKNRRESFANYYDKLATVEGARAMANLTEAAEEALAEELHKEEEAKVQEKAENAQDSAQVKYAQQKAQEHNPETVNKVQKTATDKAYNQNEDAVPVDFTNPGITKKSLNERYAKNPELLAEEAKAVAEIIKQGYPDRTFKESFFTSPTAIGTVVQTELIRGPQEVQENLKKYFTKRARTASMQKEIKSTPTSTKGQSTENVPENEQLDKMDLFKVSNSPMTVNVWEYEYDRAAGKFKRPKGSLVPANPITTPENTPDHDYINKGNLKVGDNISLVVDTREDNSFLSSEEDFINRFKILVTTEVNGETKVLGLLPKSLSEPKTRQDNNLRLVRQQLYNQFVADGRIKNLNFTTQEVIPTNFKTTVASVDSGRINIQQGLRQKVSDSLGNDFELAIARKTKDGKVYLDSTNTNLALTDDILSPGVVYALVPMANGKFKPAALITRDLNQEEKDSIAPILTEAAQVWDETVLNEKDLVAAHSEANSVLEKLNDTVYTGDISVYQVLPTGTTFKVEQSDGGKSDPITFDQAVELLQNRKAQVDNSKINQVIDGESYNQKIDGDKIQTNLVSGKPVHSATFVLNTIKEDTTPTFAPVSTTEKKETTPKEEVTEEIVPAPRKKRRAPKKNMPKTDLGDNFRTKLARTKGAKKWDKNKSMAWLKRNLPNVPVTVLDSLETVADTGGATAWGLYKDAAIYISKTAGEGTAYHEAFHAVFHLGLNEKQRNDLLLEAQIESGLNDDVALEEWLANKFEEYILSNAKNVEPKSKLGKFFKNLLDSIKAIFTSRNKIDTLFNNINKGKFKNIRPNSKQLNTIRFKMKNLTINQMVERVEMFSSLMLNEIESELVKAPYKSEAEALNQAEEVIEDEDGNIIDRAKGVNAIFARIYNNVLFRKYSALYDIADLGYDKQTILNSEEYKNDPSVFRAYLDLSEAEINEQLDQFEILLDHFNEDGTPVSDSELTTRTLAELRKYDIKIDLIKKEAQAETKEEDTYQGEDEDTPGNKTIESWQFARAEQSGKDTVSANVKRVLSKFYALDKEGDFVTDSLGFKKREGFDKVFNNLKYDLSGVTSLDKMKEILTNKSASKPYYQEVLQELDANPRFRSGFVHALTTSNINYVTATHENLEGALIKSNRNTPEFTLMKQWSSNFLQLKGNNKFKSLSNIKKGLDTLRKYFNQRSEISKEQAAVISDLFGQMGIELSKEDIFANPEVVRDFINKGSKFVVESIEKDNNPFNTKAGSELKSLQPLINISSNSNLYEQSFLNVEGTVTFSNQIPNFLNKTFAAIKEGDDYINFLQQDSFYKNNLWLNEIKKDPSNRKAFELALLDGLVKDGTKAKYKNLKDKERIAADLLFYHNQNSKNAYYSFPILADAPQLPAVKFKKYSKSDVISHLTDVAKQEYVRNKQIEAQQDSLEDSKKIKNFHTKEAKYHYIPTMGTWNPLSEEAKTQEAVLKMLDAEVARIKNKLNSFGITSRDVSATIQNFDSFVEEYAYNQVLANIQMLQLFSGDSAFYKNQGDLAKRNKQVSNPGNVLDTTEIGETYSTVYFTDIEKPSEFKDVYKEVLKNESPEIRDYILEQYEEVSLTDAQGIISLDRYRNVMKATGQWDENTHGKAYEAMKNGEATYQEMSLFMQPIKPFYFGHTYNEQLGKIVPVQNKNSEFVVFPQMLEMPNLSAKGKERIQKILDIFEQGEVDSIQFDTAVKVGASGVLDFSNYTTDQVRENKHTLFNKDYNIQLSVPEHHVDSTILFGTQLRKLVLSNIDVNSPEAIYNLDGEKYTGQQIFDMFQEAIVANVKEDSDKLTEIFNSPEKLSKILKEEMSSRGMSKKFIESVETTNGEFDFPLYFPLTYKKNLSVLNALFKSRVTKQKIKGGSFVAVSDFIFGEDLKITTKEVNGKTVIDSMEALLPWWSKKYFPLDETGNVDVRNVPEELRDLIAFRIPTEAKYSMPTIKVVGFTPAHAGGVAVLPADITRRTGEDFDVDKLFIMMPEFEVTQTDKQKEDLKRVVSTTYNLNDMQYDNLLRTPLKALEYEFKSNPNEFNKNKLEAKKFLERNKFEYQDIKKVESGLGTKASRNNRLLDLMKSILRNPAHQTENVTPGSFESLKNLQETILPKLGISLEDLNMVLPSSQYELFSRNMAGGALIGMFANHSVNHAVTQYSDLELKNPIQVVMPNGEERAIQSFNNQKDFNGKLISEALAEFLAAAVDNAKDPVLTSLNINTDTADVLALLVRAGLPLNESVHFLNVPSIKNLITKMQNGEKFKRAKELAIYELKQEFGDRITEYKGLKVLNFQNVIPTVTTQDKVKESDKTRYAQELYDAINIFSTVKNAADDLATLVSVTRADSAGSQGLSKNSLMMDKLAKIKQSETFVADSVNSVFESYPLLKAFTEEGVMNANTQLNKYFPFEKMSSKISKNRIAAIKGVDLTAKELDLINDNILSYAASKYEFFNLSREQSADLVVDFPGEFREYIENNEDLKDNKFIEALYFEAAEENSSQLLNRIVANNSTSVEEIQKEKIELAFEEMFNNPKHEKFAKDILKYSFVTNGFSFNATSIMNLVPSSTFNSIVDEDGKTLMQFVDNTIDSFNTGDFVDKFILNNAEDSNLIKEYDSTEVNEKIIEYYTNYGKNKSQGEMTSFIAHKSVGEDFIKVNTEDGRTTTFYRQAVNGENALYVKAPKASRRGYYLQYTNQEGLDYSYIANDLESVIPFVNNKIQDSVLYKGYESLLDVNGNQFIHRPEDLNLLEENSSKNLEKSEKRLTFESETQLEEAAEEISRKIEQVETDMKYAQDDSVLESLEAKRLELIELESKMNNAIVLNEEDLDNTPDCI